MINYKNMNNQENIGNKREEKRSFLEKYAGLILTTTIIVAPIVFIFIVPYWFTTIKSYESGVRMDWGKISKEQLREGIVFYNPMKTDIKKIDMRERKTTIDTETVSKEGLKFGIKITVRYRVEENKSINLVQNLQTELHELINSYTNSTIDDIATGKDKDEIYSDSGRVEIVRAVKEKLNNELIGYAIVNQVIFEDINLPASITQAIQKQQAALEQIKEKENMKQVAEKDAEIRRIEARGISDANEIIKKSLTKEYLQYEAVQKLNPSAEKVFIPTNGMLPTINY